MEFRKVLALRGPNIWANFPVLEAWVDLGELKDRAVGPTARLQRPADGLAADDDRASLQRRRARRLLRAAAPRHLPGPHPRARHARAANAGRHAGRLRPGPRDLGRRASTRSSSNTRKKSWPRPASTRPTSCAWPRSTTGRSTWRPRSRSSKTWPTTFAWGRAPAAIVRAAASARHSGPPAELASSLVQLGYGAKQRRILAAETDRTGAIAEVDRPRQGADPHAAAARSACRCPRAGR